MNVAQCPPSHRHSVTATCYNHHGCRCDPCRVARQAGRRRADWENRRLVGRDVWVPAVGAMRRLQALAWLGWSPAEIAPLIGSHYRPLLKIRGGERRSVTLSNHRRIAAVYEQLSTRRAPHRSGAITRGHARSLGFAPPSAWDDIDDPKELPKGTSK